MLCNQKLVVKIGHPCTCHNIANIVRDLIHVTKVSSHITTSGKTAQVQTYISEKLESNTATCPNGVSNTGVCDINTYERWIRLQEQRLQEEYGFWRSRAIFIAIFYSAQQLVSLYILNSAIHNIFVLMYLISISDKYYLVDECATSTVDYSRCIKATRALYWRINIDSRCI